MRGRVPKVSRKESQSLRDMLTATWWLWLRFSARRVVSNPLRVAIVILSVALATTLASAVLRVTVASVNSFERSITGGAHPYHAIVAPVGGRFQRGSIAPCLMAIAPHADILAMRREAAVVFHKGHEIPIRLVGIGVFGNQSEGESQSHRLIAAQLAEQLAIDKISALEVQIGDYRTDLEVHRVTESNDISGYADVAVGLLDIAGSAVFDSIALRFRTGVTPEVLRSTKQWIESCLQGGPPVRVEEVRAPIERGEKLLGAYRFNVLIMAAITLLVCAILIAQATQITLRSIARELAIVRTLGVSAWACLAMVVSEVAVVSAVGAMLGATLGTPLVVWMAGFLTNTASEIYNLSIESPRVIDTFIRSAQVVGGVTVLGAIAAVLGARSVLHIEPYRGTRREQRVLHPVKAKESVAIASVATSLVGVTVWLLVTRPTPFLAYVTVGVILLWSAATVTTLLYVGTRCLAFFRSFLPVRLALSTLRTSGKSFVLSGVAASVAMALLVGLALMVGSFRETLQNWSRVRLAGDIFISSAVSGSGNEGRLQPEVVSRVKELPEIQKIIPYFETTAHIGDQQIVVGGVDLVTQCSRGIYTFVAGGCSALQGSWSGKAIISEAAARKLSLDYGEVVTVAGQSYRIEGIIQEFGTEQPLVVIDSVDFQRRYPEHHPETLTLDLYDSNKVYDVQSRIRSLISSTTEVRNQRELLTLVETLFNRTFRITDSVRWIVFAMALLGLVSTTAQHLWERRRELRVAEVLGISRCALVTSLTIEVVVVTTVAIGAGLVAGVGIGWCLTEYINPLVFGWSLSFRITEGPLFEGALFIVGVAAAVWPVASYMVSRIVRTVGLEDE